MNRHCNNPKVNWTYCQAKTKTNTKDKIFLAGFRISNIPPGAIVKINPKILK